MVAPAADDQQQLDPDDTLTLLLLCCHPALNPASQMALTLRAVGGLTTAQIARAFLVPEATMAPRISRAKQRIKASGGRLPMPSDSERAERLRVVLHVLYLIFNEGYTATSGPDLQRTELTREAIRLTRQVHQLLPDDSEVAGLLALMLLTEARRQARTRPDQSLVRIDEQDRRLWHTPSIQEGTALVLEALAHGPLGPYQLQAAIAACNRGRRTPSHRRRNPRPIPSAGTRRPSPVEPQPRHRRGLVEGPLAGLDWDDLDASPAARQPPLTRSAPTSELAGDHRAARQSYQAAAADVSLPDNATSPPGRRARRPTLLTNMDTHKCHCRTPRPASSLAGVTLRSSGPRRPSPAAHRMARSASGSLAVPPIPSACSVAHSQ